MIRGIAAKILGRLCSQYIDTIDYSQLELQIWNGVAKLDDLKLRSDALSLHHFPFTIEDSRIGSISLTFPWANLSGQPCIVAISDLHLTARISGNVLVSKDLQVSSDPPPEVSEGSKFSSLMNRVMANLQVRITNFHLRLEIPTSDGVVAIGLTLQSLSAFSINRQLEPTFLADSDPVQKRVMIDRLSIYVDTQPGSHQYLLHPIEVAGLFSGSENELTFDIPRFTFGLNAKQWRAFNEFDSEYHMFARRRLYSHLGRPDRPPRSARSSGLWWRYAHRCACKREFGITFDSAVAVDILVNRSKYIEVIQLNDPGQLKAFEKSLDSRVLLYLKLSMQHQKDQAPSLSEKGIEEIMRTRPQIAGNGRLRVRVGELEITLSSGDLRPISHLHLQDVRFELLKKGFEFDANFAADLMEMVSEQEILKCSQLSIAMHAGSQLELATSRFSVILDVKWINEMMMFFKRHRVPIAQEKPKQQIRKAIDRHKSLKLKIVVSKSEIMFPICVGDARSTLGMSLGMFSLICDRRTDFDVVDAGTFYDGYVLKLSDPTIHINDQQVAQISHVSAIVDVAIIPTAQNDDVKIRLEIPGVVYRLEFYHIVVLKSIVGYLVASYPPSRKRESLASGAIKVGLIGFALAFHRQQICDISLDSTKIDFRNGEAAVFRLCASEIKGIDFVSQDKPQWLCLEAIRLENYGNTTDLAIDSPAFHVSGSLVSFLGRLFADPNKFDEAGEVFQSPQRDRKPRRLVIALNDPMFSLVDSPGRLLEAWTCSATFDMMIDADTYLVQGTISSLIVGDAAHRIIVELAEGISVRINKKLIRFAIPQIAMSLSCPLLEQLAAFVALFPHSETGQVSYRALDLDLPNVVVNYEEIRLDVRGIRVLPSEDDLTTLTTDVASVSISIGDSQAVACTQLKALLIVLLTDGLLEKLTCVSELESSTIHCSHEVLRQLVEIPLPSGVIDGSGRCRLPLAYSGDIRTMHILICDPEDFLEFVFENVSLQNRQLTIGSIDELNFGTVIGSGFSFSFDDGLLDGSQITLKADRVVLLRILSFAFGCQLLKIKRLPAFTLWLSAFSLEFSGIVAEGRVFVTENSFSLECLLARRERPILLPLHVSYESGSLSATFVHITLWPADIYTILELVTIIKNHTANVISTADSCRVFLPLTVRFHGFSVALANLGRVAGRIESCQISENCAAAVLTAITLIFENPSTGNDEEMIKEFRLLFASVIESGRVTASLALPAEIRANLTTEFLRALLHFSEDNDAPGLSIVNRLPRPISMAVGKTRIIVPPSERLPVAIRPDDDICFESSRAFRLSDLCYPIALLPSCVISRADNTLTVTYPFRFDNNFSFPLAAGNRSHPGLVTVPGHSSVHIQSISLFADSFSVAPSECDASECKPVSLSGWDCQRLFSFKRNGEAFQARLRRSLENGAIGVISASPVVTLMNALPEALRLEIKQSRGIVIASGSSHELSDQMFSSKETMVCLAVGQCRFPGFSAIMFDTPIGLHFAAGKPRKLAVVSHQGHRFIVYCPLVIVNHAGLPLEVRFPDGSETTCENNLLYSTSAKCSVRAFPISVFSPDICCSNSDRSGVIFLSLADAGDIFVPICWSIATAPIPFQRSRILTFCSPLSVVNETGFPLTLTPIASADGLSQTFFGRKEPIHYSNREFLFVMEMESDSTIVNLRDCQDFSFHLADTSVRLQVSIDGNCRTATFSIILVLSSLVIVNCLENQHIEVFQKPAGDHLVVPLLTASSFFFDDPSEPNSINLGIGDYIHHVSLLWDIGKSPIPGTAMFLELRTSETGRRLLVSAAESTELSFEFSVMLPSLQVSVIDQNYRELLLLSLHDCSASFIVDSGLCTFETTVLHFEIDDQASQAVFPVVVTSRQRFLHLKAVAAWPFHLFQDFSISIGHFDLFIDASFVSDILSFVSPFPPKRSFFPESAVSSPCPFKSFTIEPISFAVTYRGNTERPIQLEGCELFRIGYRFIPFITDAPLQFDCFSCRNCFLHEIRDLISAAYREALNDKMGNLISRIDLLFNAGGILKRVEELFERLGDSSDNRTSVGDTVNDILRGGEGFIRGVSSLLRFVGSDRERFFAHNDGINLSAIETVVDGFAAFPGGLLNGLTGLFLEPIEGAQKEGVVGAITGIRKGLVGMVAEPVRGLLDWGAGVIGGIRKAIKAESETKRIRVPRVFPMRRVGLDLWASAGLLLKRQNRTLMFCVTGPKWAAIFDTSLFLCDNKKVDIASIRDVRVEGCAIVFDVAKQTKRILCASPAQAREGSVLLNSRMAFMSMFSDG
jgi:hypothetical protein